MALSGLHVACCYAGGLGFRGAVLPLISTPVWSETLPTTDSTTRSADGPGNDQALARGGQTIFRVVASVDGWVAIDAVPNASSGFRHYVIAWEIYDFAVKPGDKLAWIAA